MDVREPKEYVAGQVPGAVPIPMSQLASRMGEIDKTSPVFVICASGNRSSAMTDLLRGAGFDAVSVVGPQRDIDRVLAIRPGAQFSSDRRHRPPAGR